MFKKSVVAISLMAFVLVGFSVCAVKSGTANLEHME